MESSNVGSSSQRVKSIFDLDDEDSDIEGPDEPSMSSMHASKTVSKEAVNSDDAVAVSKEQLFFGDSQRSSSPVLGKPINKPIKITPEPSSSYTSSNISKTSEKSSSSGEILNDKKKMSFSQDLQYQSSDESDNDFTGFDIPEGGNVSNSSIGDFRGFEVNSPLEVELDMSPVHDSVDHDTPVNEEMRLDTTEKFDMDDSLLDDKKGISTTSHVNMQPNDALRLATDKSWVPATDGLPSAELTNMPSVKIEEPEMECAEETPSTAEQDGFFDMPSPNAASFGTDGASKVRIEDVYTDSDNDGPEGSLLHTALKNSFGCNKQVLARMRSKTSSQVDMEALAAPFAQGWKREVVHRAFNPDNPEKRTSADAYYFTPNNKKLRSIVEIEKYLLEHKIQTLTAANFCFGRYSLGMDPSVERVRLSKAHGKRKLDHMTSDGGDKSAVPFKKRKVEISSTYSSPSASPSRTFPARHFLDLSAGTSHPTVASDTLTSNSSRGPLQDLEAVSVGPTSADDAGTPVASDQFKAGVGDANDHSVISRDCEVIMQKLNPGVTRAQYPLYDAGTEAASSWNQSLCRIGRPLRLGSTPASHVIEPPKEPWGARQPRLMAGPRIITPLVKGSEAEKTYHCTAHCSGVHAALPSLPCVKCRCLFHPQCIHLPYSLTQLIANLTYKLMCPNCYLEAKRKASGVKVPPNPVKPYEPLSYEDDPSTSSYSDYSDADEGVGSDLENLDPMNSSLLEVDLRPPTPTTPDYTLESYYPPPGTTEQQQRNMALEALQNLGTAADVAQGGKVAVLSKSLPPSKPQAQSLKLKTYGSQAWVNSNAKQQSTTGGPMASNSATGGAQQQQHPLTSSASNSAPQRNVRLPQLPGASQQLQLLMSAAAQQPLRALEQQQLLQNGQHMLAQSEQHNIPAYLQCVIDSYQMLEKMKVPENQDSAAKKMPSFKNYARDISLGYGVMKLVLQRLAPVQLLQASRTCIMWHDLALSPRMWRSVHLTHEVCRITCWRALAAFLDSRGCVALAVTGPLLAPPAPQGKKKAKPTASFPSRSVASPAANSPEPEMAASEGCHGDQSPLSVVDTAPSPEVVSVDGESEADCVEPMEVEQEEREDEDDHVTPGAAAHALEELDDSEHADRDSAHPPPAASGSDDSDHHPPTASGFDDSAHHPRTASGLDDSARLASGFDDSAHHARPVSGFDDSAHHARPASDFDSAHHARPASSFDDSTHHSRPASGFDDSAHHSRPASGFDDSAHHSRPASGFDDSDDEKSARKRRRDTVMEDLESPSKDDSSSDSDELDITAVSPSPSERASTSVVLEQVKNNLSSVTRVGEPRGIDADKCSQEKLDDAMEIQSDEKDTSIDNVLDSEMEVDSTVRAALDSSPREIVAKDRDPSAEPEKDGKQVTSVEECKKSSDVAADSVEVDVSSTEQVISSGSEKCLENDPNDLLVVQDKSLVKEMDVHKMEECVVDASKTSVQDKSSDETVLSDKKSETFEKSRPDTVEVDATETNIDTCSSKPFKEMASCVEMNDEASLSTSASGEVDTDKNSVVVEESMEISNKAEAASPTNDDSAEELELKRDIAGKKIEASTLSSESFVEPLLKHEAENDTSEVAVNSGSDDDKDKSANLLCSASLGGDAAPKQDSPGLHGKTQEQRDESAIKTPLESASEEVQDTDVCGGSKISKIDEAVVTETPASDEKIGKKGEEGSSEIVISPVKSSPVEVIDDENVSEVSDVLASKIDLESRSCLTNQKVEEVMEAEDADSPAQRPDSSKLKNNDFKKECSPTLEIEETVVDDDTSDGIKSKHDVVTILSPTSQCEPEALPSASGIPSPSEGRELRLFGEDNAAPCFSVSDNDSSSESDSRDHVVTLTNVIKGEVHSQDSVANSPVDEKAKPDVSMMHDSTSPVGGSEEHSIAPKIESHDQDVIEPMDVDDVPPDTGSSASPERPTLLLKSERPSKSPDVEITSSTFDNAAPAREVVNKIKAMDSETSMDSPPALREVIKGEIHDNNSCDDSIVGETSSLPERNLKRSPSVSVEDSRDNFSSTSPRNPDQENATHLINDETQGSVLSDPGYSVNPPISEMIAGKESIEGYRDPKENTTESSTNEDSSTFPEARDVATVVEEASNQVASSASAKPGSESEVQLEEAGDVPTEGDGKNNEVQMEAEGRTQGEPRGDTDNEAEMDGDDQAFEEGAMDAQPGEEMQDEQEEDKVDERAHLVTGWRCASACIGSITSLRELHLSECQEGLLEILLPHCTRLTALRISKLGHRPSNSIIRFDASLLLHAVNLEDLHLSGHFTFTSNFNFIKMRKLKKLGLIGAQLPRWPYLGTSLTHLYVSPVDRFTSDTWNNVAAMTDLVELSLGEFSEGVADSSWYVSLSRLPALRRLALTDCALGPRLLVLLKKFPQLNKIVLKPLSQHPTLSLPDQLWRVKHVWTLLPCSLRLLCDASDLTVAPSAKDPTPLPGLVFANSGSKATDQEGRQSASLQHVALSKLPQFFSRRSSTRAACFSFKILADGETPSFPHHFYS